MKLNRITYCLFIFSLSVLFTPRIFGKSLGSFFYGYSSIIKNNEIREKNGYDGYMINESGYSLGFFLPIYESSFTVQFKFKFTHHDCTHPFYDKYSFAGPYYEYDIFYLTGVNTFLIGKKVSIKNTYIIYPQIGFGYMIETYGYYESNSNLILDFPLPIMYRFKHITVGFMINYEKTIWHQDAYYNNDDRLNISFIISG